MINSTIADVCLKEDLTEEALEAIADRWIEREVDWQRVSHFTLMGIDQIALRKGHGDFVVVVTARLASGAIEPLALLADRKKDTVTAWLKRIPHVRQQQIKTVCTDMWEGYVAAVREVLSQCAIVIDRFHGARHYSDGADALRKQELARLRKELPPDDAKMLKQTLWPFRKRPEALTKEERERLDVLFEHSPCLKQAHAFREQLTTIFETARSKAESIRRRDAWRRRVEKSGLRCYEPFLKRLDTWLDLIANYFRQHHTSGFVEGLNNKLKLLKRRCYGIYNLGHLFQRITLDLLGYQRFSPWQAAHH